MQTILGAPAVRLSGAAGLSEHDVMAAHMWLIAGLVFCFRLPAFLPVLPETPVCCPQPPTLPHLPLTHLPCHYHCPPARPPVPTTHSPRH